MATTARMPAKIIAISTGSVVTSLLLLRKAFAASYRLNFSPRSESRAIVRGRAQMRAAPDHLARSFHVGKIGIVVHAVPAAARIFRDAAGLLHIGFVLRTGAASA